nr:hypothetical protein [Amycolatopsis umgeniensis]
MPEAALARHARACPYCRNWQERAMDLRRLMLIRKAPQIPDLTDRILRIAALPSLERWGLRIALAIVALIQSGLGFGQLIMPETGHGGHAGVTGAAHLGNESAAWNLAVGIGLLWAALRPRTAAGLVPVLAGFVVVLGTVSTIDLISGQVTAERVLSHSLVVVGVGLLIAVRRQVRLPPVPAPGDFIVPADELTSPGFTDVASPQHDHDGSPRLPTGRHQIA